MLVVTSCARSGPDQDPVLASEAVPSPRLAAADDADPDDQADQGGADGRTDTAEADGPDGDDAATDDQDPEPPEPAPDPAPGSSDPTPELSPDPDAEYPAGTCYEAVPGAVARLVDCGQPHDIEVYASIDLPGGSGAPYQGLDAAFEVCGAEFVQLVGIGLNLATVFERSVLRPSEETWADGERNVTCYVVYPEPVVVSLVELDPVRSFGRVSLFGLMEGDCLVDYDETASWFALTTCDEPHEAEVAVAERLPDGEFPGDQVIDQLAAELCFGQPFEDFVGRDYASSEIYAVPSLPTVETWSQGDRTINCILGDDRVHSQSFRGSGR